MYTHSYMVDKNEHPGTFKDTPEERILHITVDLQPEAYTEQGSSHKMLLDEALHQTMFETGYETPTDSLSSKLLIETPTYEARILGHGSEKYFHALGSACVKMVSQTGILGSSGLDARWRINSAQSMQSPIVLE